MFRIQNWKQALCLMALGSVFTIVGMLFAVGMLSPVTAQNDKFDTIQCSRLEVVDADGITRVILTTGESGGWGAAFGKDGKSRVGRAIGEYGGRVDAFGKDGKVALLSTDEHGGVVGTFDKDGKLGVVLSIGENGGHGGIMDKNGRYKAIN